MHYKRKELKKEHAIGSSRNPLTIELTLPLSSRTPSEVLVFISPLIRKDDNSVSRLLDVDMVTTLTTIFGVVKTF